MSVKIVPADDTINELRQKAEECEQKAAHEPGPRAGKLEEKAALLREWIKILRIGKWTS